MGMGTVLPGYGNVRPIPVPEHTCDHIIMVLPVPMSCLNEHIAEAEGFVNLRAMMFNPHLAIGENYRTLSWIWYSKTGEELDKGFSTESCVLLYSEHNQELIYTMQTSTLSG